MRKPIPTVLATLATLAVALPASAKDRPGFDFAQTQALVGMPIHVAVINERLQAQIPLMAWSEDPDARKKTIVRATPSGYGHGMKHVELFGGGVQDVPTQGSDASRTLQKAGLPLWPALSQLRTAQCDLPATALFADAVAAGLRDTTWAAQSPVQRHGVYAVGVRTATEGGVVMPRPGWKGRWANARATGRADLSQQPSVEFEVRYSLTPDFAALVTTVVGRVFSPTIGGARPGWQDKPVWTEEIVVASDSVDIAQRSEADRAEAAARENERYAALGIPALAKKAKEGDAAARQEAWLAQQAHKALMADATAPNWPWHHAALIRAPLWIQDDCARVRQALQANAAEVTRVVGLRFGGKLGALPADWSGGRGGVFTVDSATRNLATGADAGERRLYGDGPGITVSRRAGDAAMLDFRYTWLTGAPEPESTDAGE